MFVKPLTGEFGWGRSVLTGAIGIGTVSGGILALGVGQVIDKFGAKWVLIIGFLVCGVLMVSMARMESLWHFYFVIIVVRMLLQGVFNLANNVVVAKWFYRLRGRAMAIADLGRSGGIAFIAIFAQAVVTNHGWRAAALALGILTCALTVIPIYLWLRKEPQQIGQVIDGDDTNLQILEEGRSASGIGAPLTGVSFTLTQVLHSGSFYILVIGFSLSHFVQAGVAFNLLPYMIDRGIEANQGALVVSIWSLIGLPTVFIAGMLRDYFPIRRLLFVILVGLTLGVIILTQVESLSVAVIFAVVHGIFFAAILLFQNLAFADYFGSDALGAIRGIATPTQMICNALGPFAATLVFDMTGDYRLILYVYILIMVVVTGLMFFATPPNGGRNIN